MKQSKITFLTSVGAGLEYYDLVIYSLLANFISKQFFPSTNHVAALFATFGVLALGNIIRPLGGVIFGIFGDRFGRKKVFANTLLWMAGVTFLMGLIPDFGTIGLTATILFSLCRILQGIVFGAELPGALTLLSEHIDEKRHGLHFGFMISAVGFGVSLGSFVTWILTTVLTEAKMLAWGFRVPFLLGGGLALVGFYIRKHIPETPAFLAKQKSNVKLTRAVIKQHIWRVFNVIGILLFPACFITFMLVLPTYLNNVYHFSFSDIYLVMTYGCIWSSILIPIFGWISDYIDRKILLIVAALVMIIFSFPIFSLLQAGTYLALFAFIMFCETIIAMMASSYFVLLPQAFQTAIRYTGTAFSYNITYTIAALIPLLVNYIYGVLKQPNYVPLVFVLLAAVTVVSTFVFKPK
ncbi:MAG: hypothetical protein A2V89_00100 [Gammaproteobacteria bacterium RBG_16_37_9]|nr:MAG: hypothetical protein A2V89_00100 [Gammaproteobacteria bacterium RBG_16_37_9]